MQTKKYPPPSIVLLFGKRFIGQHYLRGCRELFKKKNWGEKVEHRLKQIKNWYDDWTV